jgi:16S rRNA processing protein RimM
LKNGVGDSPEDLIQIGRIVGVHGLNGALKVYSYAESGSIFEPRRQLFIKGAEGLRKVRVQASHPHGKFTLLTLRGIDNRRGAEGLIDAELLIEKTSLPELEEDTYYWFDLIGLSVHDREGGYLGCVESIIQTGSNDVYVVRDPRKSDNKELLIPAIDSVVVEIDLQRQIMRVDLPEGL